MAANFSGSVWYDRAVNMSKCGVGCGPTGRIGVLARLSGVLLVLALLFSGDIVRIHGHAEGAPATSDCVACSASLAAAVEADPPPAIEPPLPTGELFRAPAPAVAPVIVFVRQGGLRDPPFLFA